MRFHKTTTQWNYYYISVLFITCSSNCKTYHKIYGPSRIKSLRLFSNEPTNHFMAIQPFVSFNKWQVWFLSHKSVPRSCTRKIESPTSLFLVLHDNSRLSKEKASTNVDIPSHLEKSPNILKNPTFHFVNPTYCHKGWSWNPFSSPSSSLIGPYSMHLTWLPFESYGTTKVQGSQLASPANVQAFILHTKN
jgi:hypothetical protein